MPAKRVRPETTDEMVARFLKYVDRSGECWHWRGAINPNGYGHFSRYIDGRLRHVGAHRAAWFVATGSWPPADLCVCHSCDVRSCVRASHLWLGTKKDNYADMRRKGRSGTNSHGVSGEKNMHSKLTNQVVREMRRLYAGGGIVHRELSARYGVSTCAISNVLTRKTWKHVE